MLTGKLIRPRIRAHEGELQVLMLQPDKRSMSTADDLIALFHAHNGKTQGEWNRAIDDYIGERTDYVIVRGLAKVLSDSADFKSIDMPISAAELRQRVFGAGPAFERADLFNPVNREMLLITLGDDLGLKSAEIEHYLFADRPSSYGMSISDVDWTAESLIARYNLEVARAVLYWADHIMVEIHDTFKDFWRYVKLFKLMFWGTPLAEGGYQVELEGPISPFVRSTTRYGRQFAAFLPAMFLCERWSLVASVRPPHIGKTLPYDLSDQTPLTSYFKRSGNFDSKMEADFAQTFHEKFGNERGKWSLTREDEVLLLGDTVMIPDFALTHKQDGRRALIEIVGFWHPNYLRRKLEKVRSAKQDNLILLVYEGVNLTPDKLADVPAQVLYFKNKPVLKDVMALVEQAAK